MRSFLLNTRWYFSDLVCTYIVMGKFMERSDYFLQTQPLILHIFAERHLREVFDVMLFAYYYSILVIDNLRNPGLMFIPMEYNNKGYDFYIFDRIRRIFYAVQVTCTKDYAGHFQSSFLSMKKDLKSNWISYLKNYPSPSMLHFPCVIVLITRASQKIQSAQTKWLLDWMI